MDDTTIGHVAQLLQLAILTGTDIIDHFRTARFTTSDEGTLTLHPDYAENFDDNVQKMLRDAAAEAKPEPDTREWGTTEVSFSLNQDGLKE
tara:strand:- start:3838 stop:4110 length:273 start_codon:yes stop_codon:yes gene_type:complete